VAVTWRGELCALRWPDINAVGGDLLISGSYVVRAGFGTADAAAVIG
jgi:hypothetical protein